MILTALEAEPAAFEAGTGWAVRPEGACNDEICVVLPAQARTAAGRVDVSVVAERLGMPIARDEAHGLVALGPATTSGRALTSARAPALVLPDLDGKPFDLGSLRGQKVILVAWASW